jgi:hypothetical protein
MPFHDNWWQTETGGIMIANFAALDIKPGSMGLPLPGIEAAVVRRTETAAVEPVDEPMVEGELALKKGLALDDARLSPRGGALPPSASPATGISPATSPSAMPTAITGSSGAPTTSSSRPAI